MEKAASGGEHEDKGAPPPFLLKMQLTNSVDGLRRKVNEAEEKAQAQGKMDRVGPKIDQIRTALDHIQDLIDKIDENMDAKKCLGQVQLIYMQQITPLEKRIANLFMLDVDTR